MKGFCPLASGSKGNSLYVGTDTTRILIDAGISAKMLLERLKEIDVELESIQAILVTHEHVDHIQGLKTLCRQIGVPILTNLETAKGICNALEIQPRFKIFTTGESFVFGDLEIHPFGVPHDTLDPVAFAINAAGLKLGVCTDLGHVTSLIRRNLEKCDYLVLEANHQPSLVHASSRPAVYKQRVLGRQGHLSNEACANLLLSIFHDGLKHVHLAHLSRECNDPNIALSVVRDLLHAQGLIVPLSIAYQEKISQALHF